MTSQSMDNMHSSQQDADMNQAETQKPVKGGSKSSANFKNNPARAVEAGRKGGSMSGGNFKHNPARAAEAGRKGGMASSSSRNKQHH